MQHHVKFRKIEHSVRFFLSIVFYPVTGALVNVAYLALNQTCSNRCFLQFRHPNCSCDFRGIDSYDELYRNVCILAGIKKDVEGMEGSLDQEDQTRIYRIIACRTWVVDSRVDRLL